MCGVFLCDVCAHVCVCVWCVCVLCAHMCVFDVCAHVCVCVWCFCVMCVHTCVYMYPNSSSRFIALCSEERQFCMIPELLLYDFISRLMNFSFQVNLL